MTVKTRVKRVTLTVLACMGYMLLLPLWRKLRVARGWEAYRILTYHSVNGHRPHETDIAPGVFDRHMAFLKRAACPVAFSDAIETALPESACGRYVVVTLDDGYADNLTRAAPILQRHGVPAACFLTVGHIDSQELMPHDKTCTVEQAGLLTWTQVHDLKQAGVLLGSHAVTHTRLALLPEDEIRRQLRESKQMIERHLGDPVTLLSYPYGRHGDYDATVVRQARDAGYKAAATARHGWNAAHADRYQLRRIGIDASDTLFTLRAKLNGALDILMLLESPLARRIVRQVNRLLTLHAGTA